MINNKKIDLIVEQLRSTFQEKRRKPYSITNVDLSMFDTKEKHLILSRYAEKILEVSLHSIGAEKEYLIEVKKACILAENCKTRYITGTKALFDFLEKNYK